MMPPTITTRLAPLRLRAAFHAELTQLLAEDVGDLQRHPPIVAMFATLAAALQAPVGALTPFQNAWTLLYAAIGRLDSLQDGDPMTTSPRLAAPGAHYNLVFANYVLAVSLLDDLADSVPAARLLRLQRWWNDCMLRMADGQQHDLESNAADRSLDALATYQQIAQAKTGATYALAFGGLAMLCTNDETLVADLAQVGEIYGTLVQYMDDCRDAASQPNPALTLPELLNFLPVADQHTPEETVAAFWAYLYPVHLEAALGALKTCPEIRAAIATLFTDVFTPSVSA